MNIANKIWLGLIMTLGAFAFSSVHEFSRIRQTSAEYLAHWDDEIAQEFLQKRDPVFLTKILSQLAKDHIVVIEALGLIQPHPTAMRAHMLSFKYPVSYFGLPVGNITLAVSIFEILRRALTSFELAIVILAAVALLALNSKVTLLDYQRTLTRVLARIESWAERGIAKNEQMPIASGPVEEKITRWIERGVGLEVQKQKLETELEHERKWSDLSKQVVHDIRAPLSVVRALVDSPGENDRDLMRLAAERMDSIIETLHRSTLTGVAKRVTTVAEVRTILSEAMELHQRGQGETTSPAAFEFLIDVPPERLETFVVAEATDLARTFQNLINNAVEASIEGQAAFIRIEMSLRSNRSVLEISIRDHGRGMSQAYLKRIGQAGLTSKVGGSGLGLAGAKKMLNSWGGELAIESIPVPQQNAGTKVTLAFLLAE